MGEKTEGLETISKVWKSIPIGQRWTMALSFFTWTAVVFVAGWKVRNFTATNELTLAKAEFAGERNALNAEVSGLRLKLEAPTRAQVEHALLQRPPLDEIPEFIDAPQDMMSLDTLAESLNAHNGAQFEKTTISRTNFFDSLAGRRFTREGYVDDVLKAGPEEIAVQFSPFRRDLAGPKEPLGPRTLPYEGVWSINAFFDRESHGEEVIKLTIGDPIVITGVLDTHGSLRRCRIVHQQQGIAADKPDVTSASR